MKQSRKVGQNRGKPRLWLEGKILLAAGFKRGDRYNIEYSGIGSIFIEPCKDGARKVSGKGDRPVIDIMGATLGVLAKCDRVNVTAEKTLIKISKG